MKNEKLLQSGNTQTCPIAIIFRDDKVLMGMRNYTKDKWKDVSVWTNPGGRCDAGESIETALRREVREEVGITEFEIVDLIGEVPGAKEGDIVPIFYCTTTQDAVLMEPEKFSEWRWVPKDQYMTSPEFGGFNAEARKLILAYLSRH